MSATTGPSSSFIDLRRDGQITGNVEPSPHAPHRSHHAAEPDEEHRSREVDCLVGLLRVALGRLARAEKGEEGVAQVEPHELRDGQPAVCKAEAGLERVPRVLLAVAGEVDDGRARDVLEDGLGAWGVRCFGEGSEDGGGVAR